MGLGLRPNWSVFSVRNRTDRQFCAFDDVRSTFWAVNGLRGFLH